MNTRLQSFIEAENLTQSQLADSIGVARASISHILSGRNKPGFDFIEGIARKYPNLNLEWLITGKGKMYRSAEHGNTDINNEKGSESSNSQKNDSSYDKLDNLFPDLTENSEIPIIKAEEQVTATAQNNKKQIDQIIIFFSDGTYQKVY